MVKSSTKTTRVVAVVEAIRTLDAVARKVNTSNILEGSRISMGISTIKVKTVKTGRINPNPIQDSRSMPIRINPC